MYYVNNEVIDGVFIPYRLRLMKKEESAGSLEPTDVVSGIFTTRRDLLYGVKAVVAGSGFTTEEADLLISLYGARVLGWEDLEHDPEGFVAFSRLERYLVHNASLLSRRIAKLAGRKPPLLKVEGVERGSGLHFNAKRVRITEAGVRQIEPVWRRYQKLSAALVQGIPQELLNSHLKVNEEISARVQRWRDGLSGLFSEESPTPADRSSSR